MLRSLLSVFEEATLLVLPHGGQKTARRNAWRAAADLHVTSGYRWVDPVSVAPVSVAPVSVARAAPGPDARASIPGAEGAARISRLAGLGGGATTARIGAAVRGLPRMVAAQS
ncbi:hypothetical protein ND748_18605 [Frankia sp. AiPs1]|uniref:hypothetical protein n=1 Tax=Frankia sp. AiPs1 TaxID=573493 RepID=UPI0020449804|nr:hypothetical protein [Frankia sp. AiPs1]MCM3923668.1 hypothetical protein [Frankia sp. AiPs1]